MVSVNTADIPKFFSKVKRVKTVVSSKTADPTYLQVLNDVIVL